MSGDRQFGRGSSGFAAEILGGDVRRNGRISGDGCLDCILEAALLSDLVILDGTQDGCISE